MISLKLLDQVWETRDESFSDINEILDSCIDSKAFNTFLNRRGIKNYSKEAIVLCSMFCGGVKLGYEAAKLEQLEESMK